MTVKYEGEWQMDGEQLKAPAEGDWKQLLGEGDWQTMDWVRKIQSKRK